MQRMILAAVGQICSTSSMSHNLAQCETLIKRAAEAGAKALFLPEASDFISPTLSDSLTLTQPVTTSPFVLGLQSAAKTHNIHLNVGLHEPATPPTPSPSSSSSSKSKILNTLLWISSTGEILESTRYTKLHLFDIDLSATGGPVMKESNTTQPGSQITPPFPSPIGPVGSQICFDLRFPEPAVALRRLGATILVYPSAFTVPTGKMHWEVLLRARAIENQCYVVAAAQCGRHNGRRVSYGDSIVVDPRGGIVGRLGRVDDAEGEVEGGREPEILVFEVEDRVVGEVRRGIPLARRADVYGVL